MAKKKMAAGDAPETPSVTMTNEASEAMDATVTSAPAEMDVSITNVVADTPAPAALNCEYCMMTGLLSPRCYARSAWALASSSSLL